MKMVEVQSRLFRAMKNIPRVEFFGSNDSLGYFAVYRNVDEVIKISEDGLFVESVNFSINYSDMLSATCFVNDEPLLDAVLINIKNGYVFKLKISGHDRNFYDAHSFLRFLMRTIEDRKAQSIAPPSKE